MTRVGRSSPTARSRSCLTGSRFVFNGSRVYGTTGAAANPNLQVGSVYLGEAFGYRPRVMFQYCDLSNLVNPVGWKYEGYTAEP